MGRSRIKKQDINRFEKENKYREEKLRQQKQTKFEFKKDNVMYGYTLEQIESRVLADCNKERLKEHRQCEFCHLIFDCKYYNKCTGVTLCYFLDSYKEDN